MKKKILIGLGILLLLSLLYAFGGNVKSVLLGSSSIRSNTTNSFQPQLTTCTLGTTTPNYLKSGDSDRILGPFAGGDADKISMNIFSLSTSTPARLKYRYEFSDNLIDWYPETVTLAANSTTTAISNYVEYPINLASSTYGTSLFSAPTTTVLLQTPEHSFTSKFAKVAFFVQSGSTGLQFCADANLRVSK